MLNACHDEIRELTHSKKFTFHKNKMICFASHEERIIAAEWDIYLAFERTVATVRGASTARVDRSGFRDYWEERCASNMKRLSF